MKKDSITLSPKHGVNPSVTICFWCGSDIGVALLGRIDKQDSEAPREMVVDYEPCDTCKEQQARGFTLIEASATPRNEWQPGLGHDEEGNEVYPTGRWLVIKPEAAARLFGDDVLDPVHQRALIDTKGFEGLVSKEVAEGNTDDSSDQTND